MRHLAQSDAVYNGGQSEVGCPQAVAPRPARHHHRPGLPYVADPACMTPAYRILSGVMDATDDILDRFLSLSLSDEKEWESDRLEIVLDDRPPRISLPSMGEKISLALGYKETGLTAMGSFALAVSGGGVQKWQGPIAQGVVMTIGSVALRVGRQGLGWGVAENNYTNVGC